MKELIMNNRLFTPKLYFALLSNQSRLIMKYWEGFADGLKTIEKEVNDEAIR